MNLRHKLAAVFLLFCLPGFIAPKISFGQIPVFPPGSTGAPTTCTAGTYACLSTANTFTAVQTVNLASTALAVSVASSSTVATEISMSNSSAGSNSWLVEYMGSTAELSGAWALEDPNARAFQLWPLGSGVYIAGYSSSVSQCWISAVDGKSGSFNPCINHLAAGALGVGKSNGAGIDATLQSGVTATDPGCTVVGNIGKLWFDITTTSTVYKVCLDVAGTMTWVTK